MAVYTSITTEELSLLLTDFNLGTLASYQGIEGGIENTNYFVTLNKGDITNEYVLTIFEELSLEEMPFFVELGQWLAAKNIAVPYAIKDQNGIALKQLKGKPALLQPRFFGADVPAAQLKADHCFQIGEALAKFHEAGADFYLTRQAHRGVFWWRRESEAIAPLLDAEDSALLKQEVRAFDRLREANLNLPMGVIHGDLFHDNALFKDDALVAILDMYNAATAYQLYDLAIVANDWCCNADSTLDPIREKALLQGYASIRAFTDDEAAAWPVLTRTAAMRFWLSRLIPWLGIAQASRQGGAMKLKDPNQYKQILLSRIKTPAVLR
ncbi:homoserine kinase [Nitrincola tibetensis]|uniref:Homoserine kinase n=1 Tax=Nitrincola tibetensis TaxID=2219697 RepID=A0A364NI84_9GAMM|nr:homoserine kinase [Nitrincola tibetensis]RAU16786.1 homoserine kinase [Nitrincola tibetensis]